jgi:hypothetical protein
LVVKSLEPADGSFGNLRHPIGVTGIAKVNATPERSAISRGAASPDLVGTFPASGFREAFEEKLGFDGGKEQRMPVLRETAAAAARIAARILGGDFRVDFAVQGEEVDALVGSHQMRIIRFLAATSSIE